MNKKLVFSIEEFSTFDGPGIRTTVFLKGCPLRCSWCHNPEGQSFQNEIIKAQTGCVGCGTCLRAGNGQINSSSIAACPNRLLRFSGEVYTPLRLVDKLSKNFDILQFSGGGITFSGGEPLSHPEFLVNCLDLLNGRIHTAVQTSGYAPAPVFEQVLKRTDYFLFDIKLVNSEAHRRYTGVGNEIILHNLQTLINSRKEFIVRTPLIPCVTDTEENLGAIAGLLKDYGITRIELLPYNKAASSKYAAVGRTFTPDYDENIPCNPRKEVFEAFEIRAVVL